MTIITMSIGKCSKGSIGIYSPDQNKPEAELHIDASEEVSDHDSDIDEAEAAVDKSVERIMDIVNSNAKKRMEKRAARRQAAAAAAAQTAALSGVPASPIATDRETEHSSTQHFSYDAGFNADAAEELSAGEQAREVEGSIREMVISKVLTILNTGTHDEVTYTQRCFAIYNGF